MTSFSQISEVYRLAREDFAIPGYMESTPDGDLYVIREIMNLLPQKGKLLDIGAGALDKTTVLSRLGFQCFAADDYSDPWHGRNENLGRIREQARKNNIQLHVHNGTDYSIPFPQNSFDVVCLFDVIEHLHRSPRDLLNSAGKMLKAHGLLIITMPNSVNLRKRLRVLSGYSNYPDVRAFFASSQWRGHVREYTLQETHYILKQNGFRVRRANTFDRFLYKKISFAPFIWGYKLFATIFPSFRDSLFVAAVKPPEWIPVEYSEKELRDTLKGYVPEAVR